jgi:hypothetical protein
VWYCVLTKFVFWTFFCEVMWTNIYLQQEILFVYVKTKVGVVMCFVFWIYYVQYGRGAQAFQKSRSHLKILGARRITGSRFHTEDAKISCTTLPNLVTTGIWHLGYAHPFNKGSCLNKLYQGIWTNNTLLISGGDPTGTGKGGAAIYGRYFDDEIHEELKHTG